MNRTRSAAAGQKVAPSRLLLSNIRPVWRAVVLGGVLGLFGGAAGLAQPLVAKAVIDAVTLGDSLVFPVLMLTGLIVISAVLTAAGGYTLERSAESVVLTARTRLISRMLRLRLDALEKLKPGDLISRATSDITLLRSAATHGVVNGITGVLMMVGSIVLMAVTDLVLLLATVGVLVVIGLSTVLVMPYVSRANESAQAAIGDMGAVLERALGAFRTVKACGAEQRDTTEATNAARSAWSHGLRAARWQTAANVASTLALQAAFLVVLGLGGARVASGTLAVSSLIVFLFYILFLAAPVSQVVSATGAWHAGLAAIRRMHEVEQLPREFAGVSAGGVHSSYELPPSVTFSGVWFGYRADLRPVLSDVTINVPRGGITAVVGPSGAGKSTMFSLVERFYEVDQGAIAVDGRDVRHWTLTELRRAIGYVEQDAPVLAGTLRDNLCYGSAGATDAVIYEVLARARLTPLLAQLPDGLDTTIGHRGTTLSGGQRQRIAVARALLRKPRLLLLDEITSQLDASSEQALREAVEDIAGSTTVMVIAHRLSTVTNADRIIVLDAGRVRAVGTHDRLMDSDALYRELAASQFLSASGGAHYDSTA